MANAVCGVDGPVVIHAIMLGDHLAPVAELYEAVENRYHGRKKRCDLIGASA
jgi:hypothetical protein